MNANLFCFLLGFIGMFAEILIHGRKGMLKYVAAHWDTVIAAALIYVSFAGSWWLFDMNWLADIINGALSSFLAESIRVTFDKGALNPVTFVIGFALQGGINVVAMRMKKWHERKDGI